MAQQYGLRASNNLLEVEDKNACWDNLGVNRADLALLVGTSDAGVTEGDYQAIIGLSSNLESQIVTLSGSASSQLSLLLTKASKNGDTFTGSIFTNFLNNDRPYTTQSGLVIGPSTSSFFSPSASGNFATGAEYKLGPVTAATITTSGVNYTGTTISWGPLFERYKNYATVQQEPSWTNRLVPLFLPPPTAIDGCIAWFDAEYSATTLDTSGNVEQWKAVSNGPVAVQTSAASRPSYVTNVINGKPAIRFDGSNDSLSMGNLGEFFPSAATVVIKARVLDSRYNIFSTLNNSSCRWNDSLRRADLGVFTSTIQTNFPTGMENNGTFTFAVRASAVFGLEIRKNGIVQGYKSTGFTYSAGDNYIVGTAPGGGEALNGDIYSIALFNRVLSDRELRTVEEYLAWRYDGVYDTDRTQILQLEDFAPIELEDGTPLTA